MTRARARWPRDDEGEADALSDDSDSEPMPDAEGDPNSEPLPRGVAHLTPIARVADGRYRWRCTCLREVTYAVKTVELLATLPRGARCPRCHLDDPATRARAADRVARARAWRERDTSWRPAPAPRCGAWARSAGRACVAKALANGRCRRHGGAASGPRTAEGRARLSAAVVAWWTRWRAATPVELPDQLADVETARGWLVEAGARLGSPVRLAVAPDRPDVEAWREAARALGVLVRRRRVRR